MAKRLDIAKIGHGVGCCSARSSDTTPPAIDGLNKEKGVGKEWEGRGGVTGRQWIEVSRRAAASVSRVSTKDFFFIPRHLPVACTCGLVALACGACVLVLQGAGRGHIPRQGALCHSGPCYRYSTRYALPLPHRPTPASQRSADECVKRGKWSACGCTNGKSSGGREGEQQRHKTKRGARCRVNREEWRFAQLAVCSLA
eukprot:scaffold13717_cov132-Isochrysis_galbana.AAC.9